VQTVAQASFDAWIRYYRPDAHTPNSTVSYYTKGALVALCLDLSLRREGRTTLDDVLRTLWQRSAGGPMDEAVLREVLQDLGGRSFDAELDAWVHSTAELPLAELLQAHGMALQSERPATGAAPGPARDGGQRRAGQDRAARRPGRAGGHGAGRRMAGH
jgi:predicted metalloprotease with PDZ domain